MKENLIQEKTFLFAKNIISIFKVLKSEREYIISKQLIRSGTTIGALIEETIGAESTKDFLHKISIAYKEARETKYWLRLLLETEMINKEIGNKLLFEIEEILRIIGSIQKTTKAKLEAENIKKNQN